MNTLRNILIGLGESMNPFGTSPQYTYPKVGDRVRDVRQLRGDMTLVGKDLKKAVAKALEEANGEVNHGTDHRQR